MHAFIFIVFCTEIPVGKQYHVDSDQMPRSVAFELGLHFLHMPLNRFLV